MNAAMSVPVLPHAVLRDGMRNRRPVPRDDLAVHELRLRAIEARGEVLGDRDHCPGGHSQILAHLPLIEDIDGRERHAVLGQFQSGYFKQPACVDE